MSSPDSRTDAFLNLDPGDEEALRPRLEVSSLLGARADLRLTTGEAVELARYEQSLVILGPAGGSVLICPGNQENTPPEERCAYYAKCPLVRFKKAPQGQMCPVECKIVEDRFGSWCRTMGQNPGELTEDTRSAVSSLTYIDVQEQRCTHILSTGEAARLTQTNVTDAITFTRADPETGEQTQSVLPLTWERVLHVAALLLAQLQTQRRMILKDWMLTPEQQWKVAKAEGKAKGNDIGTQQSIRADKLLKRDPDFL